MRGSRLVVLARVVEPVALHLANLFGAQPEDVDVLLADLFAQSRCWRRPRLPTVSAPFIISFMLPVPLASMPAVEICSLRSAAGMIDSASETR